jgi:hypothetical protein
MGGAAAGREQRPAAVLMDSAWLRRFRIMLRFNEPN